jgi:hypothetical protein
MSTGASHAMHLMQICFYGLIGIVIVASFAYIMYNCLL